MTAMWQDARTPALAIVARGDQIETVTPTEYVVRSQSRLDVKYRVKVFRDHWECDCPFYAETKAGCIHIYAVRFREGFKTGALPEVGALCSRCGSGQVTHNGKRHNESGTIGRYICKACGFRFTGRDGFQRRRADPEKIALALDLYFRGMSVRKVSEHFRQVHGLKVGHVTVYNWVAHFGKIAAAWMDAQGAKVGETWHVDETVVSIDGKNKFIWNVMDSETRFLLSTYVSKGRSLRETRVPFQRAKEATSVRPTEIRSDGMPSYPYAIKREFGRYKLPDEPRSNLKNGGSKAMWSPHRVVPSIRAPESNNLIERLHGSEKERIKVMRGFDNERGTGALMEGYRAHYNLVRDHQTLGKTPGEAAGFKPLSGFRWHELLKRAAPAPKAGYPEIELVVN
ncbi:MAG: DDE-type integrase/transposase/recombinase [Thermoplasmata archaeon]